MIAQVAVSCAVYAIDQPYSYRVPENMELLPGMRVVVPFGRANRRTEAIVLAITTGSEETLKAISQALDESPVMDDEQLRLAAFVRERYFCTYYDAVKAILPAGLWFRQEKVYRIREAASDCVSLLQGRQTETALMALLEDFGGSAPEGALLSQMGDRAAAEAAISWLLSKKIIENDLELSQKSTGRKQKFAAIAAPEEAARYAEKKKRTAPVQAAVLELLGAAGESSCRELTELTGASSSTFTRLQKLGLITLWEQEKPPELLRPAQASAAPPVLNNEQQTVFDGLFLQMHAEKPGAALLYGVTGSGKTAVYISLIYEALREGKGAVLLVPEISLTPQLLGRLAAHFGEKVAVLHSSLRIAERFAQWRRIRDGEARVVVGTRSAVFAPVRNLGLLILDEEQEHTYKSENSPRYHAREIALYRGAKAGALVLLGSATPSIESMYKAKHGDYTLYTLKKRYNEQALPQAQIVDLKQEIRQGNATSISSAARARKLSAIKAFYNYLTVSTKQITENPVKDIEFPKIRKSLPKYLSLDESKTLLKAVQGPNQARDFAILMIFLNCGIRRSELVGLNLTDVYDDRLRVVGKGNKERIVYMGSSCRKAIDRYLIERSQIVLSDNRALFGSRDGNRISVSAVHRLVKKHLLAAGLDSTQFSAHKLRHTAATLMLSNGVDLKTLQEVLGHENLNTTQIYTHIESTELKIAAEANPLSHLALDGPDTKSEK